VFKRASVRSLTIVAVLAGLNPAKAGADAIVITSGSLTNTGHIDSPFSFMGDGLSLQGGLGDFSPLFTVCFPCRAGSLPVFFHFAGDMGTASGTVGGTPYSQLWLGGEFGVSGTARIPSDGPSVFSVSFPSSVMPDSFLLGWTNAERNGAPVFRVDVTGTGTGELTLTRETRDPDASPALYDARSARFDFGPESPSPTPEPATLLLCASGLVLAGARRLRRR
jgi:hypothetical protein